MERDFNQAKVTQKENVKMFHPVKARESVPEHDRRPAGLKSKSWKKKRKNFP